jgi:AcrR family transcriptional regulator
MGEGRRVSATKRLPERRDEILRSAMQLFYEKGFRQASMSDIAAAVGTTAPALYRHFKDKADILDTAVRGWSERELSEVQAVVDTYRDPEELVPALVAQLVAIVLEDKALAGVVEQQRRYASDEVRAAADRADRLVTAEWVHAVRRLRSDLSEPDVRAMVFGARGVVYSVTHTDSGLDTDQLRYLLNFVTRQALVGVGT